MDVSRVNKIILNYLSHEHIHNGYKVKEIKNETISTYDGLYPSFEIIYEGSGPKIVNMTSEIIHGIEKYTGLKSNRDFWVGISCNE